MDARSIEAQASRGRAMRLAACALLALATAAFAAGPPPMRADDAPLEDARTLLSKLVESRRAISAEKRDWTLAHDLLVDRVRMVARDIAALREHTAEVERNAAEAGARRAEIEAKLGELRDGDEALEATLRTHESRLKALLPRLPDPIRERVRPLTQLLPDDPAATKRSRGERLQAVVGILNEIDKFQREVTVTSEVRTLADGARAEVTALYLGVSHGFYVSGNGRYAGVGMASATGFAWTAADDAAPEILHALAILKNDQVAAFTRLPIRVE